MLKIWSEERELVIILTDVDSNTSELSLWDMLAEKLGEDVIDVMTDWAYEAQLVGSDDTDGIVVRELTLSQYTDEIKQCADQFLED